MAAESGGISFAEYATMMRPLNALATVGLLAAGIATVARADAPLPLGRITPTLLAPTPLDPPLPPIIAPRLPGVGHWRVERMRKGPLVAGIVIGSVSYGLTAIVGIATRDYPLSIPAAGPLVGVFAPAQRISGEATALLGAPALLSTMAQVVFAPLFITLGGGGWPRYVWQGE
jgi:hypothetical protein